MTGDEVARVGADCDCECDLTSRDDGHAMPDVFIRGPQRCVGFRERKESKMCISEAFLYAEGDRELCVQWCQTGRGPLRGSALITGTAAATGSRVCMQVVRSIRQRNLRSTGEVSLTSEEVPRWIGDGKAALRVQYRSGRCRLTEFSTSLRCFRVDCVPLKLGEALTKCTALRLCPSLLRYQ